VGVFAAFPLQPVGQRIGRELPDLRHHGLGLQMGYQDQRQAIKHPGKSLNQTSDKNLGKKWSIF